MKTGPEDNRKGHDRRPNPAVVAVCGVKNSGKTTLIVRLVSRLAEIGLKTAVIKHDGHDFTCDVPGTDSRRFTEAGAYGSAVFSDGRMFVHRVGTGETEKELIRLFPEADIILLEGCKDSTWPKIEVIRGAVSSQPVSNPEGRLLIATDLPQDCFQEETADINDADGILDKILSFCGYR